MYNISSDGLSQAFRLIDKEPFRRLLTYLRPTLSSRDIPHRTKLRQEILERAELVQARVKTALQVCFSIIFVMRCIYYFNTGMQRANLVYVRHMDFR
jgi:hypothetical protein